MNDLSAIVLVGGFGTRLHPVTYHVPKQLLPIAGQSALYHVFDLLPASVTRIGLSCGYKADEIAKHLESHPYPIPVSLVREDTPLGTGGGMKNAASLATDPFFLLNGDVVAGLDLGAMLKEHLKGDKMGTMSLFSVEDTQPYGVAELGPDDRIIRFVEKPAPGTAPSHWINAGAGIWKRDLLDSIPSGRKVSFEQEILPGLLGRGVYGFRFSSWWEDAGTPGRLLNAQRLLFDNPGRRKTPWTTPREACVVPPVAVGADCRIHAKRLGKYVTLGDQVVLEEGTVVEDSVIMDRVVVGSGAVVRHSIIAPGVRVPPGTVADGVCLAPDRD